MPKVIMEKPWDVQHAKNVLYRLYAEQYGLPPVTVICTPKSQQEPVCDNAKDEREL